MAPEPSDRVPSGPAPGLVVAAPRSGSGKTTRRARPAEGAIARAASRPADEMRARLYRSWLPCRRRGRERAATSTAGRCARPCSTASSSRRRQDADLVLCEALMGLFDGVATSGATDDGSSAAIAARTGWPVLLVLDISGQSQSAGAVAAGFAGFRPGRRRSPASSSTRSPASATALSRARRRGSRPARRRRAAAPRRPRLARAPSRARPGRGDRRARRRPRQPRRLRRAGTATSRRSRRWRSRRHVGCPAHGRGPAPARASASPSRATRPSPSSIRISSRPGARRARTILPFSPLADEGPDATADVAWLPGGYPELHGGRLAANTRLPGRACARFARRRPVHGECGGFMVLGTGLVDADGARARDGWPSRPRDELRDAPNVTRLPPRACCWPIARSGGGSVLRGHEFHYATIVEGRGRALFEASDAEWRTARAGWAAAGPRHAAPSSTCIDLG